MRDFHSDLRATPFLDRLRRESIFIPMGRAHGHHEGDSLNAEMTGQWTARFVDSSLSERGYRSSPSGHLPKSVIEYLAEGGYEIFTCMGCHPRERIGSWAVGGGMTEIWLQQEPQRLAQFHSHGLMSLSEWLSKLEKSKRFYGHVILRDTHRPWGDPSQLFSLLDWRTQAWAWARRLLKKPRNYPYDAYLARRAALENPEGFAALRRQGLARADAMVRQVFEATRHLPDVTYVVYSNHGEMFDHFRYNQRYSSWVNPQGLAMVEGTSHGSYPYEVLYANTQMWCIPGWEPRVMQGIGRSIDFTPTILALAKVKPERLDGQSMLNAFTAGKFEERERFAETPTMGGCLSMVRPDGMKLVALGSSERGFKQHRLAVFDLRSDPNEYVNLIDSMLGQQVLHWAIDRHAALKQWGTPVVSHE